MSGETVEAGGINWRKYAIGGGEGTATKDRNDLKALGYTSAIAGVRKSSQATITDLRARVSRNGAGGVIAVEDPKLHGLSEEQGGRKGVKVDSETNTDHSMMMMRKQQGFVGFRRPLSGSNNVGKGADSEQLRGERLSNYTGGMVGSPKQNGQMKSSSGAQTGGMNATEAYLSTLERRKKELRSSDTQTSITVTGTSQSPADYSTNTLGRRRGENLKEKLFGSRSSLNKLQMQSENANLINSTIISNPHATFSRHKNHHRNYSTDGEISPTESTMSAPGGRSPYVNVYLSPDAPQRPLSALSSPTGSTWMRGHNGLMHRSAMSEAESMESISSTASSSIQAQIQQAKALAQASRNILQRDNQAMQTSLHRSDSFKSTKSEMMFPTSTRPSDLPRTNSFTQLSPNGNAPSSPTASQGSRSSFQYPTMSHMVQAHGMGMRANGTSPYTTLMYQSKLSSSKDDDCEYSCRITCTI